MAEIKFGTDGWRALIAKDFTVQNVARVARATALWAKEQSQNPSISIGHDCRFGGQLFVDTCVSIFLDEGIKVFRANNPFVTTPMVSLATRDHDSILGVVITASHNPPDYQGYKLKGSFGGPLLPGNISQVEKLIPDSTEIPNIDFQEYIENGHLVLDDFEERYYKRVLNHFDFDAIRNSKINIGYDAMYGAGQNIMKRLFPDAMFLHCSYNPSFMGQAPEPIAKNLQEFSTAIKENGKIQLGITTDGDADRIGLFDAKGNFVDSHRIILLLIHYLHKYQNNQSKVVTAFSTSERIAKLCTAYNLEHITTKIGFKYIAGYMIAGGVMLGGEESGGIAISGFIPERDGIWIALTILEFMAKTEKTLDELIDEVYEVVGPFAYDRNDLRIPEEQKQAIVKHCEQGDYKQFGDLKVIGVRSIDGYKYELPNETYVLIRASGTEPLLRVYCEAPTMDDVQNTLQKVKETILT